MLMRSLCAGALVALAGSVASAGIFFESEVNNTPSTANDLGAFTGFGGSVAVDGTITPGVPNDEPDRVIPGDVDFFRFSVPADAFIGITVFDMNPTLPIFGEPGPPKGPAHDGILQILNADFITVAFDDDSGLELMPMLGVFLPAGNYYIGLSSYDDWDFAEIPLRGGPLSDITVFDGIDADTRQPHTDAFTYKMVIGVNIIPTPGAAALAGVAGLIGLRRRR